MNQIKLKRSYMINELDLPCEAIIDEVTTNNRWSIFHLIVFEYEGKFYKTHYSVGATEMQYESPWDDEDEIECTEVEEKEVIVKKWIPVV